MKTFKVDLKRALLGKWFVVSLLGNITFLWIGLGAQSTYMISELAEGYKPCWNYLLYTTLTSPASTLSLPALAALPFAGAALSEIHSNAYRYALFRSGRTAYSTGKTIGCLLSATLVQLISLAIVVILGICFLRYDSGYVDTSVLVMSLISRILCAGLWACLAGTIAIMTKVSSAVYVAPLAISYSLSMIGRRLLTKASWIDPDQWLRGNHVLLVSALVVFSAMLHFFLLKREVKVNA